ncbi:mannosyltransferase family protein [Rugosimonospora acidiphila]|uniref:mannosyltransferase family protein n=1 Tax=Rugosimonospora acidiphila TaxID=556531 RepID=UPI0031E6F1D1
MPEAIAGDAVAAGDHTAAPDPPTLDSRVPDPPAGTADRDARGSGGWRGSLLFGLWTWLGGLLACVLVTAVAWLPFEQLRDAPRTLGEVLDNWHRWDTTWYVIIAQSGYRYDPRGAAFFPLYPLLVRGADRLVPGDAFVAALVVAVLTCYAALVVIHRLTDEILGAEVARRTIFYLLAFPTGFFLIAAYNESLFLALAVGSLYCMRRRVWWLAAVLAGLASGTRLAGALLAVVFVYEYLRQRGFSPRRIRPDLLWAGLAPAGLVAYAWYCARTFGDPLYFQAAQGVWSRSGFSAPWTTLIDVTRMIVHAPVLLSPTEIRNIINLGTALAVLALLYLALDGRWRLGREQSYLVLFAAMDIALPLLSPLRTDYPLSSLWRFALECVPVFMVLARMGRNQTFDRLYLMAALPVQGVMILTFVQNQFVA